MFKKAIKSKAKGRIAITGPSGSGKSLTSLYVARGLVGPSGKIAAVDSEFGSLSKYSEKTDFDVSELDGANHPAKYIDAIKFAESNGYDAIILDSLTHAWEATKLVVDKKKMASNAGNGYVAWSEGTALWNALLAAIMSAKVHVIVTMRSKTDYVQETDDKGKKVIRKVGMAPETRDGTEYAFDAVLDMDFEHIGRISKTRCDALDGYAEMKPGIELGGALREWLETGIKKPILADGAEVSALLADLAAAGFSREDYAAIVGASKKSEITVEQFDALSAALHQIRMSETEPATEGNQE